VPEAYTIILAEGAEGDFRSMTAYERRLVLDGMETHLSHRPTEQSRRIKKMRPNPIAAWELRLGDYRVLYDVGESERNVIVQVIGEKVGNRLIVQGEEYTAHESHRPERGESES
jgi:mRNA-degrading endonuclease RelE of RelBE toxin-antitoxin system